jgi:hypothetical protein
MLNDGEKNFQHSYFAWNFFAATISAQSPISRGAPSIMIDAAKLGLSAFLCAQKISPRSTMEKYLFNSTDPAARVFPSHGRAHIVFTSA